MYEEKEKIAIADTCDFFDCSALATGTIRLKVGKLGFVELSLCEACKEKFGR
jgi:hypothetical protein